MDGVASYKSGACEMDIASRLLSPCEMRVVLLSVEPTCAVEVREMDSVAVRKTDLRKMRNVK